MGAWRAVCDGNPTPMLSRLVDLFLPRADVCCWQHSDASRQRSTSVAFGAKRTLTEPRLQKAELRVDEAGGPDQKKNGDQSPRRGGAGIQLKIIAH